MPSAFKTLLTKSKQYFRVFWRKINANSKLLSSR